MDSQLFAESQYLYLQARQREINHLSFSIAEEPDKWIFYFDRAEKYLLIGNYKAAICDYNQVINQNEFLQKSYIGRGKANSAIENMDEALKDFNCAIQVDPNNVLAYHYCANVNTRIGKYEEVINIYNRLIGLDPEDSCAYCNRGLAKEKLGKYQESILDYTKSIELNEAEEEESLLAYFNRGNAKLKTGDKEGAIEDYDLTLKCKPRDISDLIIFGKTKKYKGDKRKAIEDFTAIIQSQKSYTSTAYYERAVTKFEIGDLEGAIEDANKSVELSDLQKDEFDKAQALELIKNIKLALL
jgi:tetratricopeptide (TPR) repeat protein